MHGRSADKVIFQCRATSKNSCFQKIPGKWNAQGNSLACEIFTFGYMSAWFGTPCSCLSRNSKFQFCKWLMECDWELCFFEIIETYTGNVNILWLTVKPFNVKRINITLTTENRKEKIVGLKVQSAGDRIMILSFWLIPFKQQV